ncbi:MAG: prolyl oligopeptidase family serine peptidase, partial [Candidatus Eisenbacteria bacterium]|nr:prolyl oligopeptidase family serine peptidase [Candidatus Eisenbacteria bacterium]
MRRWMRGGPASVLGTIVLAAVLAGIMTSGCGMEGLPPIIPRETLFGNPQRVSPRLSPDGTMMAYRAPEEGVLNVWLRTVGEEDDRAITHDRGRGIMAYFWAENGEQILYIQDKDGDENWRIYAAPLDGGEPQTLTPMENVQARIYAVEKSHPDEILIGLNDRVPQLHDVYRLNTRTGDMELVAENNLGAIGWMADHDLTLRLAVVPQQDGGMWLMHREGPDENWELLTQWGHEDALTTDALKFAADNETLYMISSVGSNTAELRALNVATGEEEVLAKDPEADVSEVMFHPTTYEIQAVGFTKERLQWEILDEDVEDDFTALAELHRGEFRFSDRDNQDETWLVAYVVDDGPVAYYSFATATNQGTFLFTHRPELEDLQLAQMKPISYEARDGVTIHGYLTLPPNVEPAMLPAVVNVHGGPYYRDTWGYNPEAQWLANRGYACLQINFRGSTGYGKKFLNLGDREWGGTMQDDITDGVHWMMEQGYADSARVGIYGASYGGYAVLSGLTTTPELYACGVDVVGPSNLVTFIQSIPPYWEPMKNMLYKRVGNPETEEDFLKSRSPLYFVDNIEAPLFIAQGANDPRVKKEESLQIVNALREAGKTVEYLEFPDEGHGF